MAASVRNRHGLVGFNNICKKLAEHLMVLLEAVDDISAERDDDNNPTDSLPPVEPLGLFAIPNSTFRRILMENKNRLLTKYTEAECDQIGDDFMAYKDLYRRDPSLVAQLMLAVNIEDHTFADAWEPIVQRYPLLFDFFGTLATVFPSTATVESDFSILKWTKDDNSQRTSDFSLEGKLHARQWKDLQEVILQEV
jgi:hypothetical protein